MVNLAKALEEGSLAQDPFVQEFRAKRLEEMKKQASLGVQRYVLWAARDTGVHGVGRWKLCVDRLSTGVCRSVCTCKTTALP